MAEHVWELTELKQQTNDDENVSGGRRSFAAALLGQHIVLFGGYSSHPDQEGENDGLAQRDMHVGTLNGAGTDVCWREVSPRGEAPSARHDPAYCSARGQSVLFVFGGQGVDGSPLNGLFCYRQFDDHWVAMEALGGKQPAPRANAALVDCGEGKLLLCGGCVYPFDPMRRELLSDAWLCETHPELCRVRWTELTAALSVRAALPLLRAGHAMVWSEPEQCVLVSFGWTPMQGGMRQDVLRMSLCQEGAPAAEQKLGKIEELAQYGRRPCSRSCHAMAIVGSGCTVLVLGGLDASWNPLPLSPYVGSLHGSSIHWSTPRTVFPSLSGGLPRRAFFSLLPWPDRSSFLACFGGDGRNTDEPHIFALARHTWSRETHRLFPLKFRRNVLFWLCLSRVAPSTSLPAKVPAAVWEGIISYFGQSWFEEGNEGEEKEVINADDGTALHIDPAMDEVVRVRYNSDDEFVLAQEDDDDALFAVLRHTAEGEIVELELG